jgi:hypothetical protein
VLHSIAPETAAWQVRTNIPALTNSGPVTLQEANGSPRHFYLIVTPAKPAVIK